MTYGISLPINLNFTQVMFEMLAKKVTTIIGLFGIQAKAFNSIYYIVALEVPAVEGNPIPSPFLEIIW